MSRPTFIVNDRFGTPWDLSLDLYKIRRADKSDYGDYTSLKDFSLLQPDQELIAEIFNNHSFLVCICWAIVHDEVKENLGIDPKEEPDRAEEEFMKRIDADTLHQLREVLWRSLADFFPQQKEAFLLIARKMKMAQEIVGKKLPAIEEMMDKAIEEEISREMDFNLKNLLSEIDAGETSSS